VGIGRRADICEHLIRKERWDLFLTAFGETHAAGHYIWHQSQPDHPLHRIFEPSDGDPLLRTYQEIDRAIARIEASLPPDAYLVVFAAEGMEANCMDLPSTVFLPELLYRHSLPGSLGLGVSGNGLGEIALPSRSWVPAVWGTQAGLSRLRRALRRRLPSALSYKLDRLWGRSAEDVLRPNQAGALGYQPTMWYRHLWPRMKAFALPSFSEGYVRINVKGREASGIVDAGDYDRLCDEVSAEIASLTDAHTGKPIVREVRRTRRSALDDTPGLPDADLVVRWMPLPTDTVDTRSWGRIGPLPYARAGSHTEEGFAWFAGPGIEGGTQLPDGRPASLAPTLLAMLGAPIPAYMKQPPLF
jgi:predicted AlkP superfamily phosphohydrolase/phosphomutase